MKIHKRLLFLLGVLVILAAVFGYGFRVLAGEGGEGTLEVTKDAFTSYDRTYEWSIEKTVTQSELRLAVGETGILTYHVTVDAIPVDSNILVTGTITVHNPDAALPVVVESLADTVSPDIAGTVECGSDFPYELAAGADLLCPYTATLTDTVDRLNTATATIQMSSLAPSVDPTNVFTGTADVIFGDPDTVSDDCVEVSDSVQGVLGTVCAGVDTLPKVFTYTVDIGPYDTCGTTETLTNTASFVTNDTATMGEITSTVTVTVPCATCAYSQGYWKTHSTYGPAPYDDTWALVEPDGEDSDFFLSGQSWYDVMWTPPKKGNAYYIMSHQYIAAILNQLKGVDTSAVDSVLADAETLLNTYTPDDMLSMEERGQFLEIGETLDQFNNGLLGAEHCGDEPDWTGPMPQWIYSLYSIFLPVAQQ